jgi:hypothetical protein
MIYVRLYRYMDGDYLYGRVTTYELDDLDVHTKAELEFWHVYEVGSGKAVLGLECTALPAPALV